MKRRSLLVGAVKSVVVGAVAYSRTPYAVSQTRYGRFLNSPVATKISGGRTFSPQVFVDNQSVYELIPDRLYRVGCTVKAERLSWLPADLEAFEPLNCYLLIDGDLAFFVDTGMAISEPAVGLAMQEIVRERDIHVTFTRNEADCIGNLGFVLGTAEEPTLMFGGVGGILEWINDPSAAQLEPRDFLDRVPVEQVASPTRNNYGDLTLRWLDAGVKEMFLTQWVFEEKTGCLFTSDTYGFRHLNSSQATPVIESVRNLPSVDAVAREFAERINWLPGSHYPEVIARLKSIFAELDVQMIAPVHGCVLKGRDVVAAHVDLSIKALEAAAALPA